MSSLHEINKNKNKLYLEINDVNFLKNSLNKLQSLKYLEKVVMNQNNKRYGAKAKIEYNYLGLIMDNLIFNKNSHLVSVFKDYMIYDYLDEFLKRFYPKPESNERVPKFATFYKNYLNFFCKPTIRHKYLNDLIHKLSEKKAEIFYNKNYKSKNDTNSLQDDYGIAEDSESDEDSDSCTNINNNISKTIFNETIKKKIEKYSPYNSSIVLPESDAKLKPDDSALLITYSNEMSLKNILEGMKPQLKNKTNLKSHKNNKTAKTVKNEEYIGSHRNYKVRINQKHLFGSNLNKLNLGNLENILITNKKSYFANYSKNCLYSKDSTNSISKKNNLKNQLHKNKSTKKNILSYIGLYKNREIQEGRNNEKSPENLIKFSTPMNNFMNGSNNNNKNQFSNYNSCKKSTNLTSITNYNINAKKREHKNRNQYQSQSINSKTNSRYSFDKINFTKKYININFIQSNNVEYIINQLKMNPFNSLKKYSTKKKSRINNKKDDKSASKKSKILIKSKSQYKLNGIRREINSFKNLKISKSLKTKRQSSYNNKLKHFPSTLIFLRKATEYIKNICSKSNKKKAKESKSKKFQKNKSFLDEKNLNSKPKKIKYFETILLNNKKGNINLKKSSIMSRNNGTKLIHNFNININNQINIGGRQLNEFFSFSDFAKKNLPKYKANNFKKLFSISNKGKKTINSISRNKNKSLEYNTSTNNYINNGNSLGNNINSFTQIRYNNKDKLKMNYPISGRRNNHYRNNQKRIKLSNEALFRSMKVINSSDIIKKLRKK